MTEALNRAWNELSIEMFLEALMTYMAIQGEAAKQLFEKEPAGRTPEAYMKLLNDLTEEFSRDIQREAPEILPRIRTQNESFQEMLKYKLNRES